MDDAHRGFKGNKRDTEYARQAYKINLSYLMILVRMGILFSKGNNPILKCFLSPVYGLLHLEMLILPRCSFRII